MIKINLLGAETESDDTGNIQILVYFASIVFISVICFVLYSMDGSRISRMETEAETMRSRLTRLKEQTKEVRDLEQKKQELQQIAAAIGQLKIIQVGPVKMLSELDEKLPAKLWLRKISDEGGDMAISGIALDDFSVSSFLKGLQEIEYFKNPELQESTTVNLIQIAAFNAFDSTLVRYVVPATEQKTTLDRLKGDAEKAGLKVEEAVPEEQKWRGGSRTQGTSVQDNALSRQGGFNTGFAGGAPESVGPFAAGNDRTGKIISFGVRKSSRDPRIYIWKGLEETPGKMFKIKITSDFLRAPVPDSSSVPGGMPAGAADFMKPGNFGPAPGTKGGS